MPTDGGVREGALCFWKMIWGLLAARGSTSVTPALKLAIAAQSLGGLPRNRLALGEGGRLGAVSLRRPLTPSQTGRTPRVSGDAADLAFRRAFKEIWSDLDASSALAGLAPVRPSALSSS